MKDFDAVVFDMDGVLLDSETPLIKAFEERAAARGLKADIAAICHRCLGVTRDISRRVWQAEFGEDFDYDAMRDEAYALFMEKTAAGVPMKPYVPEMLAWLKAAGKKVGLASSTPWAVVTKELKTDGLIDYFDALVCGDMVSRSKPDPAIYLRAARGAGSIPENCAYVGDNPVRDVEGALDAGYGCMVLFEDAGTADREGKAPKRLPDYRIHAIPELLDLFPLRK